MPRTGARAMTTRSLAAACPPCAGIARASSNRWHRVASGAIAPRRSVSWVAPPTRALETRRASFARDEPARRASSSSSSSSARDARATSPRGVDDRGRRPLDRTARTRVRSSADDDGARPSSKIGSQDDLDAKAASRGNAARARKTPKKKTPSSSSSSPRSRRPGASADGGDGAPSKATTARNKRRDRAKKTRTTTAGGEGPGPGGVGDANASGRGKLLTADEEKQLGGAIQQLLRIEAMENELVEASIAEELRRDKAAAAAADRGEIVVSDVFSKDFGKAKKAAGGGGGGGGATTSTSPGRDKNAPAFRRALAAALGYTGANALKTAIDAGQNARRQLVVKNVGLAYSIARDVFEKLNHADRGLLSVSDLAQEGCAGLAQAADKFDPSRGYKFSTYAYNWTRKYVVNAIQNNGRTIRLPIHMHEIMQRAKKATRELTQKHGRAPTDEEMSRTLGVPVSRVQEINDWARSTLSLDVGGGGRSSDDGDGGAEGMMDGIVFALGSKDGKDGMLSPHEAAEADMEADLLRRDLEEAFATLLPREAFVLRHRFGLAAAASSTANHHGDGGEGWLKATAEEVEKTMKEAKKTSEGPSRTALGTLLGVSHETIRTYERRALEKLKQPSRAARFVRYLDKEDVERYTEAQGAKGAEELANALSAALVAADAKAGGGRIARRRNPATTPSPMIDLASDGGGGGGGGKAAATTKPRRARRPRKVDKSAESEATVEMTVEVK